MTDNSNSDQEWSIKDPGLPSSFLGKQVRVVLDYDDPVAVSIGQLLAYSEDGEAVVLDDDGTKFYCWPMLKIQPR